MSDRNLYSNLSAYNELFTLPKRGGGNYILANGSTDISGKKVILLSFIEKDTLNDQSWVSNMVSLYNYFAAPSSGYNVNEIGLVAIIYAYNGSWTVGGFDDNTGTWLNSTSIPGLDNITVVLNSDYSVDPRVSFVFRNGFTSEVAEQQQNLE
jgi:hypothetical protein